MQGKQRYRCKDCACNFTQSNKHGYSPKMHIMAYKLYIEGLGFRAIGRFLNVSNVIVLKWIKNFGYFLEQKFQDSIQNIDEKDIDIIEVDELWHFIREKKVNFGYGLLFIEEPEGLSPLLLVHGVEGRHLKSLEKSKTLTRKKL